MSILQFLACLLLACASGLAGAHESTLLPARPADLPPRSITVVLDDNYPPYIFRDANGQIQGILKDTWALWQERTGIAVTLQAMDWAAALKLMETGQAEVIDTLFKTEARKQLYDFAPPYATLEVPIFFHSSLSGIVNAESLKGFSVGVKDGDACIDVLLTHGVDSLKGYPSYSAVVAAAAAGDIRVFCMDQPPAMYLLAQQGVAADFRHSQPISVGQFHRAVRKGERALLATLEHGFARITAVEYHDIDKRWMGSAIGEAGRAPYARYVGYLLLAACLITLTLALWNLMLHRRVQQKTRSLSDSLTALEQARQVSEQTLLEQKIMLENSMFGIVKVVNRVVVWANPAFEAMFGYGSNELVGSSTRLCYPSEEAYQDLAAQAYPVLMTEKVFRTQIEFVRRDGTPIWVDLNGTALAPDSAEFLWIFIDITERRAVDERLRKLSRSVEQAPIAIVITDLAGCIEYANPRFTDITGYTLEEVHGQNPRILQSGLTASTAYVDLWQTLCAGGIWQGELHNRKKNGELFTEHAVIAPVLDASGKVTHYVALKQDISLRKQAELALQASLQEKVALLNEVHHRVKNNLQVITSLLRLEAGRSAEPNTKAVLKEMQGRIYSMALLHETLYRSGSFASVELGAYLRQLATQAFRAQVSSSSPVGLQLELAQASVSLDQATTCGLLVNELISNSLKHGFVQGRSGQVVIGLQVLPAHEGSPELLRLQVSDNGVGLPSDFAQRCLQSLGMQLVSDLVRQLGGSLHIDSGPGTRFEVTFTPQS